MEDNTIMTKTDFWLLCDTCLVLNAIFSCCGILCMKWPVNKTQYVRRIIIIRAHDRFSVLTNRTFIGLVK